MKRRNGFVTCAELAKRAGVSKRRIYQYVDEHPYFPRDVRGGVLTFPLKKCLAYIAQRRERDTYRKRWGVYHQEYLADEFDDETR